MLDILILSFNKVNQTIKCLKSVISNEVEIHILDNGSSFEQLNELKLFCIKYSNIHLYISNNNLGVAGGRNFLIKKASNPWLLFLDNDTYFWNKKWYLNFKKFILNNDKSNVVIPTLYNLHNNTFSSNVKFIIKNNELKLTYGNTFDPNVFPGGAVFIKKSVFDENGYYDDQMLVGFEDFEFAIRLYIQKKNTLNIKLVSKLVIIHDHRILKNINNINTVKVRYDLTELDKSFDRLITKHKLVFNHDYIEWTKLQVSEMTSNSDSNFIKGIKLFKMYFHILKHQC